MQTVQDIPQNDSFSHSYLIKCQHGRFAQIHAFTIINVLSMSFYEKQQLEKRKEKEFSITNQM